MTQQSVCVINYLDHVGVVVGDVQEAMQFYSDVFGISMVPIVEEPTQRVFAAVLEVGQTRIELLQATHSDSTIGRFMERQGPGLHHIAFSVKDINETTNRLRSSGFPLTEEQPREGITGMINFIHPKATHGVLIELVQPK